MRPAPPVGPAARALGALVDSGRVRILLQLSRPRSASNAITRLAATGADLALRSYAMERPMEPEPLCAAILDEIGAALEAHPAGAPLTIYLKEHAASLSPAVVEALLPLVERFVLVLRDPLLTHASHMRLLALPHQTAVGEAECSLVRAVALALGSPDGPALWRRFVGPGEALDRAAVTEPVHTRDPHLLGRARRLLDAYAEARGAGGWRDLQAGMKADDDFAGLTALLDAVYPIEAASADRPDGARRRLTSDPFGFMRESWRIMRAIAERAPERCAVVEATALQARGPGDRELRRFAEGVGLRALHHSGWRDARDDRTMGLRSAGGAAWYLDALVSEAFRLPTRPTRPLTALPAGVQAVYHADLADYVALLASPALLAPAHVAELAALLERPVDDRGTPVHRTSPTTAYALLTGLLARGDAAPIGAERAHGERLLADLRGAHPEHGGSFDRMDDLRAARRVGDRA